MLFVDWTHISDVHIYRRLCEGRHVLGHDSGDARADCLRDLVEACAKANDQAQLQAHLRVQPHAYPPHWPVRSVRRHLTYRPPVQPQHVGNLLCGGRG